ncbi:MAG: hypothetical protein A2293_06265 [Elusimicrobia bacterium RIFOXYB2_FULL_49_7]|nr:MAG: hypothetical protein A2293_06265 [Elusimicrobia bacterium RIFOXYB2_FULL_49_7]
MHSSIEKIPASLRGYDFHAHTVYHIILYNQNTGWIRLEDEKVCCRSGDLIFISPMQRHQFLPDRVSAHSYKEITFSLHNETGEAAGMGFETVFAALGCGFVPDRNRLTQKQFRRFSAEMDFFTALGYNPPSSHADKVDIANRLFFLLKHMAEMLSISIPKGSAVPHLKSDDPLERIIQYLNRNYSLKISLQQLAELASCSREHLCRRFRRHYGCTLVQYLENLRLSLAEKLLATSNLPIKEICSRVGMEDIYYFSKRFKRKYGLPPRQFINQGARERLKGFRPPPL